MTDEEERARWLQAQLDLNARYRAIVGDLPGFGTPERTEADYAKAIEDAGLEQQFMDDLGDALGVAKYWRVLERIKARAVAEAPRLGVKTANALSLKVDEQMARLASKKNHYGGSMLVATLNEQRRPPASGLKRVIGSDHDPDLEGVPSFGTPQGPSFDQQLALRDEAIRLHQHQQAVDFWSVYQGGRYAHVMAPRRLS